MVDLISVFKLRAEVRAYLWFECAEYETIEEALAPLFADAVRQGLVARLGERAVKQLIEAPFYESGESIS